MAEAADEIRIKAPEITYFEGSSTSDTLALEHLGGSIAWCVEFFAAQEHGRFRFVTKFNTVDGLLHLNHRGHTKIRFSINSPHVIRLFEQQTASLEERIEAARKVADAGYAVTFELIQHRFTPKSRRIILAAYPKTRLPLEEAERVLKPGKFPGAGKYVYPKEEAGEIRSFMEMSIRERFPAASIEYFT